MANTFQPNGRPTLIGSLPISDHGEAVRLVFEYTPDIPVWVQLPVYLNEGMIAQFLPGMPGLAVERDRQFVDTQGQSFDGDMLAFYEAYMAVMEGDADIEGSRFALKPEMARGFFAFSDHLRTLSDRPLAVKGQVTGPVTFTTGVTDRQGRAIFYDAQTRDAAVKLLALKARWQVRRLSAFARTVIVFLDEPALAGFGSSEMISISREEISACLAEVVDAVHAEGGLAGIHVCANTDWSVVLGAGVDIVNFDAYAYFDRFILYPNELRSFIAAGGILAWGIVPTLSPDDLDAATTETLTARWDDQFRQVAALGIDPATLLAQSIITPSCGAGSLDPERALRVLRLTRAVSDTIHSRI